MAEAAGLVLATFPIVIGCVNKLKAMRTHRIALKQMDREMKAERTIFANCWNRLLEIAGEDTISTMSSSSLRMLDSHSVTCIIETCEDILDVLQELKDKFDNEGTAKKLQFSLSHGYCNQKLTQIHRLNGNLDRLVNGVQFQLTHTKVVNAAEPYNSMRDHASMIYDALKEKLQEKSTCECSYHSTNLRLQMSYINIGKPNKDDKDSKSESLSVRSSVLFANDMAEQEKMWRNLELEQIQNAGVAPHQSQLPRAEGSASNSGSVIRMEAGASEYTRILKRPSALSVLSWPVVGPREQKVRSMTAPPNQKDAILPGLTPRSRSFLMPTSSKGRFPEAQCQSKGVLLEPPNPGGRPHSISTQAEQTASGVASTSQQIMVATETSNRESTTDHIISCLCSDISRAGEMHCCIGIIVSRNARRHRVWVPKQPLSIPSRGRAITLANILRDLEPGVAPALGERLKLCVRLASAVLQLHDTEWLNDRWSKDEIWFIQEVPCRNPVLKYPLVRRVFRRPGGEPESTNPVEAMIGHYNTNLFSLGMALIELWYWKSLEAKDIGDGWKHFLGLRREAPPTFSDAVRRCFGDLDYTEAQLLSDGFKNMVYSKIVLPLVDMLKWFCGNDDLAQILEEY